MNTTSVLSLVECSQLIPDMVNLCLSKGVNGEDLSVKTVEILRRYLNADLRKNYPSYLVVGLAVFSAFTELLTQKIPFSYDTSQSPHLEIRQAANAISSYLSEKYPDPKFVQQEILFLLNCDPGFLLLLATPSCQSPSKFQESHDRFSLSTLFQNLRLRLSRR